MMNLKGVFHWFYEHIGGYNLFIPEENEYDDNDDEQPKEPATVLKHQKYMTWLYIFLLTGKSDASFFLFRTYSCTK
jgi:hypothetical protein